MHGCQPCDWLIKVYDWLIKVYVWLIKVYDWIDVVVVQTKHLQCQGADVYFVGGCISTRCITILWCAFGMHAFAYKYT